MDGQFFPFGGPFVYPWGFDPRVQGMVYPPPFYHHGPPFYFPAVPPLFVNNPVPMGFRPPPGVGYPPPFYQDGPPPYFPAAPPSFVDGPVPMPVQNAPQAQPQPLDLPRPPEVSFEVKLGYAKGHFKDNGYQNMHPRAKLDAYLDLVEKDEMRWIELHMQP